MIIVKSLYKTFKLYKSPSERLKEIIFRKQYYREYQALKNISFQVNNGETLGIIGPNGAGKSTLLKILTGILLPDKGEIHIDGKITGLLELGTGFNAEMTGLQNIYMNGTLLGMSREEIDAKKEAIIAFSELGDFINEPLKTYSSGMVMRLAFSIAIHAEPKCFVVDEALAVGDAHFQQKCINKIKEFRQKGGSIIFVSHDMNAVKMLCDKAILLHQGEIIEEGDPEKVVNSYNFLIAKLNDTKNVMELKNPEKHSYGTFEAEIVEVTIKGQLSGSDVLSAGEQAVISVKVHAHKDIDNATVGILIRDKFGQDIFGTNTFHLKYPLFLKANQSYIINFKMPMNIGPGKYTITAAIHTEDTHVHRCFHWEDCACSFEVAGILGNFFSGIARLEPEVSAEIMKNKL